MFDKQGRNSWCSCYRKLRQAYGAWLPESDCCWEAVGVVNDSKSQQPLLLCGRKSIPGWWRGPAGERYAGMAEPETVAMEMGRIKSDRVGWERDSNNERTKKNRRCYLETGGHGSWNRQPGEDRQLVFHSYVHKEGPSSAFRKQNLCPRRITRPPRRKSAPWGWPLPYRPVGGAAGLCRRESWTARNFDTQGTQERAELPGEGRGRKVAQESVVAEESCFLAAEGFGRTLTSGERRPERGEKILKETITNARGSGVGLRVWSGSLPEKMSFGPCQGTWARPVGPQPSSSPPAPRTPVPPWRAWGRGATRRSSCRPQSARCLSPAGRSSQIPSASSAASGPWRRKPASAKSDLPRYRSPDRLSAAFRSAVLSRSLALVCRHLDAEFICFRFGFFGVLMSAGPKAREGCPRGPSAQNLGTDTLLPVLGCGQG